MKRLPGTNCVASATSFNSSNPALTVVPPV